MAQSASLFEGSRDLLCQCRRVLWIELHRGPLHRQALLLIGPWNDVKVHVLNGLVRSRSIVLQDIVLDGPSRLHHGATDAGQYPSDCSSAFLAELIQGDRRLFGDHQGVPAAERANVEEGQNALVFIDAMTRDLATKDLGEDRFCHDATSLAAVRRSVTRAASSSMGVPASLQ